MNKHEMAFIVKDEEMKEKSRIDGNLFNVIGGSILNLCMSSSFLLNGIALMAMSCDPFTMTLLNYMKHFL